MQSALSQLRSWKFDHKNEDVRGWAVTNADGRVVGKVGDLIVDTGSRHVTHVVLDGGRQIPAHDLLVGDHVLTMGNGAPPKRAALAAVPAVEKKVAAPVRPAQPMPTRVVSTVPTVADLVIPIVEESFEVGTRRLNAGGYHVESHIVEKPFDEDIRLRDEAVRLERRKVDQPLTAAEANDRFREGMVEVTAKSEYPIVEKRSHIVEEVVVTRGGSARPVQVRENLRRTAVEMEDLPKGKPPVAEVKERAVAAATRGAVDPNTTVIPIVDEDMSIAKRQYDAGGVRVTTRIDTRPVEKTVTVREEHVTVQRRNVDRAIGADEDAFRDRAFDVAAFNEEPILTKSARIVEEVRIHKDATERVEHIHDTLRHTDVNVAELPVALEGSPYEAHYRKHFHEKGLKYNDVNRAYRFGEDLRRSAPTQDWTVLESAARQRWETVYPNTWATYLPAIRAGWERRIS